MLGSVTIVVGLGSMLCGLTGFVLTWMVSILV